MRNLKKNTHTLTEGSIWKGILLFALPLLGSSLIQQLYSTVDLIFVGQLLGTKASAAIGASGLIVTCLIGFSMEWQSEPMYLQPDITEQNVLTN